MSLGHVFSVPRFSLGSTFRLADFFIFSAFRIILLARNPSLCF
jgi:hypothetical protein